MRQPPPSAPLDAVTRRLSESVRRFILRNDRGRNPASFAHVVTPLPRPRPDFGATLAARPSPHPTAPDRGAYFPGVLDVVAQLFSELVGVSATQVDLVRPAVETKRNGTLRLTPVEVVDEKHLGLLRHEPALQHKNQFLMRVKLYPNLGGPQFSAHTILDRARPAMWHYAVSRSRGDGRLGRRTELAHRTVVAFRSFAGRTGSAVDTGAGRPPVADTVIS